VWAAAQDCVDAVRSCLSEDRVGMKRAVLEAVASRAIATGADLKLFAELTLLHHTDMVSPRYRTRDTVSVPMLDCSGHCCIGPESNLQSGGCVRFQCALSHHASKIEALPASFVSLCPSRYT